MTRSNESSEAAKATLRHGAWLHDEATKLYIREGIIPPPTFALLGDEPHTISMGAARYRSVAGELVDAARNRIVHTFGGVGIFGAELHATQVNGTPPYSFLTRKWGSGYGTSVFAPSGMTDDFGMSLPILVDNPAIAGEFHEAFRKFTPEDILIEQRGELTDREQYELHNGMRIDFCTMLDSLNVPEGASLDGARIEFKLPDGIEARVSYIEAILRDRVTGALVHPSDVVSLDLRRGENDHPVVTLSSSHYPGLRSASAYVTPQADKWNPEPLRHDDIMQLAVVMRELAKQANHGIFQSPDSRGLFSVEDTIAGDAARFVQPQVDLTDASQEVIARLLTAKR